MEEPLLPDQDRDLQLARSLGLSLESGYQTPMPEDPLAETLARLRDAYIPFRLAYLPSKQVSQRLWERIDAATRPHIHQSNITAVHTLRPLIFKLAVAASFLVAVAIGWMLLKPFSRSMLVAEASDAIAVHVLEDGSSITLRPHSKLYGLKSSDATARFRLAGEAFFDVTHNEERTFTVEAENARISVLGTEFTVNTWKDEVTVYLREGRVELKNIASDRAVILSPGQSGAVSKDEVTSRVETNREQDFLDWMNHEIAFTSSPIRDIIKEVEFHYDIAMEFPSERADETITGPITLDSLESVLDQLSLVIGSGHFVETGNARYRFESN